MALTKEVKQELIGKHGRNETDTGSPEVQIAMLTRRINDLTEHLRTHRIAPPLVLCSSSARTRQTLERISAGFAGDVEVQIEDDLYTASADDLLARLRTLPGDVGSVMVIGHDPALPELARRLAGRGADLDRLQGTFPTAALATLSFGGGWRALAPGAAKLVGFVKPKELKAAGRRD